MSVTKALSRLALTLAAVGVMVWPLPSYGYQMISYGTTGRHSDVYNSATCDSLAGFEHWTTRSINWYLNTSGLGAGKQSAVQAALDSWTNVPDADYVLNYAGTTTAGFATDGVNSISFGDADTLCSPYTCHAITALVTQPNHQIIESDILLNSSATYHLDWRTDGISDPCSPVNPGNRVDTQAIVTHELGHSLGIGHPFTNDPSFSTDTMGAQSCSAAGRSLEADDQEALKCSEDRYPYNPVYEGYVDQLTCQTLSGWAWNSNRPNRPSYVDIKDGSTLFQEANANLYRSDLQAAGKGNGYHAFSISPSNRYQITDGQWHTISSLFSGTGGTLTGGYQSLICNNSLFAETLYPASNNSTGGLPYEVATQFSSQKAGKITQLGFYWASGETGTHTGRLWSDTGTLLATVSLPTPFYGSGWSWGTLSTPVAIPPGARYRVSVTTYTQQSKDNCGLSSPYTNGALTAHQGFWIQGSGVFPTTSSCSNFWVTARFDM